MHAQGGGSERLAKSALKWVACFRNCADYLKVMCAMLVKARQKRMAELLLVKQNG